MKYLKFILPALVIGLGFSWYSFSAPIQQIYQGGTGVGTTQKGDLLVGTTSPFNLTVLSVGTNNYCLTASSSKVSGLAWSPCGLGGGGSGVDTLATGTAGSIFNGSIGGTTLTLNLPFADSSKTGQLTSGDWTTFNNKVSTSRSISTTFPLQGGGDLSGNRTLSITTGDLALVSSNLSFSVGDGKQVLLGTSTTITLSATPLFTSVAASTTNFTNASATNATIINFGSTTSTIANLIITGTCTGCGQGATGTPQGLTNSVQYNAGATFGGSQMFWVNNTPALGINSSSPSATLVVSGTTTNVTLDIFNVTSSSRASYLKVTALGDITANNATFLQNGKVGIGTTTPNSLLTVFGDIRIASSSSGQLIFPDGSTMSSAGLGSANSLSAVVDAIITGDSDANGSGDVIFKLGTVEKLRISNTTLNNLSIGIGITPIIKIGNDSSFNRDTIIGRGTGPTNDHGTSSAAMIYGNPLTLIGYEAGKNMLPSNTACVGGCFGVLYGDTAIGSRALINCITCQENTAVGQSALANSNAFGNTAVGLDAGQDISTGVYNNIFGNDAFISMNGNYNAIFGNVAMGGRFLAGLGIGTSNNNSVFGSYAAINHYVGDDNVFIGTLAGSQTQLSTGSVVIGSLAARYSGIGNNVDQSANVLIGYGVARLATTSNSTIIGYQAGSGNYLNDAPTCNANGQSACGTNSKNTMFGYQTGYKDTMGSGNLLIGYQTGYSLTTGSNNILIGYNTDIASTTSSTLSIANLLFGTSLSNFSATTTQVSAGRIGIGTSTPIAKLTVMASSTDATIPILTLASSSGTSVLTVLPNGNLGLSSSTPTARLTVVGLAGNNFPLVVASSTGTTLLSVASNGSTTISSLTAGPVFSTSGGGLYTGSIGSLSGFASSSIGTATTTAGTRDKVFSTNFTPKVITINYVLNGYTSGATTERSAGTAVYDGTTLKGNYSLFENLADASNVTANAASVKTTAPTSGGTSGNASQVTLSVVNVTSTGFTVRETYTFFGGGGDNVISNFTVSATP